MRSLMRTTFLLLLLPLAWAVLGCGGETEDPIMRLSSEEALEQGKALLAEEKYAKAGPLLIHAFEVEPNSRNGREALLLAADALFLRGGNENYVKCEAKYRDFLNRFPTSDRSDYAQFQVANCLAHRVEKPDRDQTVTRQAMAAYEELLRLYPTSPYSSEAQGKITEITDRMAAHELVIGDFYLSFLNCPASIARLEYLQQEFPSYTEMERVYYTLGMSYELCNRKEDADKTFDELQRRYPESEYLIGLDKERQKYEKRSAKFLRQQQKKRDKMLKKGKG